MKAIYGALAMAAALTILGAGCSKEPSATTAKPSTDKPQKAAVVRVLTQDEIRAELNQALDNFKATKSFRTASILMTAAGDVTSKFDVAKPNRFKGTLTDGKTILDIVVVDQDVYLRANNNYWTKLVKNSRTKTLAETFKTAFSGDSSLDKLGMDETKEIKKTKHPSLDCDVYQTEMKLESGGTREVDLCVKNGYPVRLEMDTDQGPLNTDYYDLNAVFLVERPMK